MRGEDRKQIIVRMKPELLDRLSALAEREYRSVNGEIEYLVAQAVGSVEQGGSYPAEFFDNAAAFIWDGEERELLPMRSTDPVRLTDLKRYEEEKRVVVDNTLAFINGLPAQNVLLYGDRGTGKSSTVHAVLNEYADRGLRLIEVKKKDIISLPRLMNAIAGGTDKKFIIFIDDLTFVEGQDNYGELKAVLEGSALHLGNVLIYATTNRRHLIKETAEDRKNDMHESDLRQEQMSLSDRFGIVVTYLNPDKREFIDILRSLLSDRGITLGEEELELRAERFCLEKGGRSPRGARQLADIIVCACREEQEKRCWLACKGFADNNGYGLHIVSNISTWHDGRTNAERPLSGLYPFWDAYSAEALLLTVMHLVNKAKEE